MIAGAAVRAVCVGCSRFSLCLPIDGEPVCRPCARATVNAVRVTAEVLAADAGLALDLGGVA